MKKMPKQHLLSNKMIDRAFNTAKNILENETGNLEYSPHDWQCFIFKSEKVFLIFYPHKTTAGNYSIRVRDQASKDKNEAENLMDILGRSYGNEFTFTKKISNPIYKSG